MKKVILFLCSFLALAAAPAQNTRPAGKTPVSYAGRKVSIVTTASGTAYRLTPTDTLQFAYFGQPLENQPCIFVDPAKSFQTFIGIGAALTDASAETFAKMPAEKQEAILKAFYDKNAGIGYSLARTNIHSCDFSSGSYTYVQEGDQALKTFSVAHDEQYRIPFIKKAIAAAGGKLNLFVSPWSPPAWMKDNNDMLHGGKLKPEYFQAWANYFVKFIQAYESRGIPVWGLTLQNEPMAKQIWESCMFTAEEERDFIKKYLGPTLHRNGLSSKKIIAWDHNRDLIYQRASTLLSDPEAARYIWGIGFHWYESWTGAPTPDNVKRVSEAFPNKPLLLTEACNGPFSWETIDDWQWGEKYGESMINDFNNGATAWTDWNILLDETGGPNHVKNFCFAPLHADTRDGSLHFTNAYYYIGHFSKYIRPGARRIISSSNRAQLLTTGFRNPDGKVVVVVMNPADTQMNYRVYIGEQAVEAVSLPNSITTLVF